MMKQLQAVTRSLRRLRRRAGTAFAPNPAVGAPSALQRQLDLMEEREQSLRITLASMGDGVIATDEKARITFLNPSAQELTDWALEDAVGRPFSDIFRIYNSVTGLAGEDIVQKVLTTGRKVNLANHTVLISRDNVHRHISDSAAPIRNAQGDTVGVVLIFSDVTERYLLQQQVRVSEARSTAAVKMARLGTWEYEARLDAIVWSPMYKQIMGVPPDSTPEPDSWSAQMHPDDLAGAVKIREEALKSGDHYAQQYRIYRKNDGALRYIKSLVSIERDEGGEVSKLSGVVQDITEEFEVGERIRESEELYRSAFERAVVGMAHVGLDGRYLRANRSLCEILQFSEAELLEMKVSDLVHPDDAALLSETLDRIVHKHARTSEAVRRFFRKDGAAVWLSISSTVMFGREGEALYILSSIQDITARLQAQAALAQSERRLRRAQELAHTGNWEIDLKTKRMWASDEAFRIYGLPQNDENTLPLAVPQRVVVPEHRALLDEALARLLKNDTPYDLEFDIVREEDGTQRTVHSIAVADRDKEGRPLKIIGVLQDVTDRRRLQEEYGKALSTTLDGFWLCDKNVRVTLVNDAMCAMLGYTREELIGMSISELEVQVDPEVVKARRHRVLSSGAERFEAQLRRKDGTVFDTEVSLSYIPSSDSTCAFMRDITDRKRRENHIRYLSYHDVLTGLYNRAFFEAECARLEAAKIYPVTVVMGDINGLKLTNDVFGHAQGDKLLYTIAGIVRRCTDPKDIAARIGGDEFCLLMPGSGPEEGRAVCDRIGQVCEQESVHLDDGSILKPSLSMGFATRWNGAQRFDMVFKQAEDAMYKRKLLERKSMHSSLISSIRTTMYEKSRETREHADRLSDMACRLGRMMQLDEGQISELELLCSLHDLGKIGIPEHILDKPGPLTEEEWIEMRKHPEIGYRIAQASPELITVAEGILCHHERWDGRGYPQGLRDTGIPILARILSVVDSFDAMTTDRVYHKAISREKALGEISACAGSQFDPSICSLFIDMMRREARPD
jgi:diguanylate cyclase (GGDEF)-like protein/PAS domain S-box-containing protein